MKEKASLKSLMIGFGIVSSALIVILTGGKDAFWNSIAIACLMVYFWLFELVPIYVTALFPLLLALPLGVLDKNGLAQSYGNSNVYLFFGGFVLALALEKWDVHKQIARRIIGVIGNSKPRLILGFILSTGLLSMWISNTATALMMLPMAMAIIHTLPKKEQNSRFGVFLLLSIAYAASIGGMATLVGSPPNLVMAGILETDFGIRVDFISWMKIGAPLSIVMMLVAYLFFNLMLGKERKEKLHFEGLEQTPWTSNQKRVLTVFLIVVLLWSTKNLFETYLSFKYEDVSVALLGAIALFFVPASSEKKTLLVWKDMEKIPWGILILFGGGLALANMLGTNGVIDSLSNTFDDFTVYGSFTIMLVLVAIAIFGTELMSNLALVTVFIPVIASFAESSHYSILQLCVPVTLAASCAFMLPVGTPPNAIIFSSGNITISQMAKYGFVLNLIALILIASVASIFL